MLPTVLVEFGDGINEQCIVDTGYDGTVLLSSALYAKLLDQKRLVTGEDIPAVIATGPRSVRGGSVAYMKVGRFERYDVPVRDGIAESRIGLDYLRLFHVTIDIPHDRIYLAIGAEFDKPDKVRSTGIGLLRKNEKTIVNWIKKDSPAQDAGISVDDELVLVAGEPVAGRPLAEIKWMLGEKVDPSGKLKLLFRRADQEREVELTIHEPSSAHPLTAEQAAMTAEIRKLGGKVTFDDDAPGKPIFAVNFSEVPIGDEALKSIAGLTELKVLLLGFTQVTDAGLKHIEGLTELRSLLIDHTRVTDAGLEHIKPLVQLNTLMLDSTKVTDAGLKQLSGLVELKRLGLNNTQITDDGLKQLSGLRDLNSLSIMGTKVTPAGRAELKQALPSLQDIWPKDE